MAKRRYILTTNNPPGSGSSSSKRQRIPDFGAPSDVDSQLSSAQSAPTSSAHSKRQLYFIPPSLLACSIEVFSRNLAELHEKNPYRVRKTLGFLSDPVSARVLAALKRHTPQLLSHEFLVSSFLRKGAPEVVLSGDLPGVNSSTAHAVGGLGSSLRKLELSDLPSLSDTLLSGVVQKLPLLEVLVLRGCTKVGAKTVDAAACSCPQLRVVNLNRTTPTPVSIGVLLGSCPLIEVLKLESVPNITSQVVPALLSQIAELSLGRGFTPLQNLKSLKLRGTRLTDIGISNILSLTPNLLTLDVSFTSIRNPFGCGLQTVPPIEKLSITQNPTTKSDITSFLPLLPRLKRLHCGALGLLAGVPSTLTDSLLLTLTDIMEELGGLEQVNLVGNVKLGLVGGKGRGALADFVLRVGSQCKALNLDNLPHLHSEDLQGLLGVEQPSPLITLTLSNTSIGDEASQYIASCESLETLEIANTKFTAEGVCTIVEGCSRLTRIDLTACRGIKVGDRRRFFEAWEEGKQGQDGDGDAATVEDDRASRTRSRRT